MCLEEMPLLLREGRAVGTPDTACPEAEGASSCVNPRLDTYVQVYVYLCTILMYNVLYIMCVIILSMMK